METSKNLTKQLVLDAMLAALCAVLGYLSVDFLSVKVTFESLPILMGALLFGPLDGFAVGGVGTLIYQLLRYGVSATTVLWMLPYMVCGLAVGWYASRRKFDLTRMQTIGVVVVGELLITLLNTPVIYADSKLYGYYFPGIVTGVLALRLGICVVKAAVFGAILPALLRDVRRALRA